MASERAGFLSEGALLETLARGNKDVYFFTKDLSGALNPFEYRYSRRPGTVPELRRVVPLNAPDFARTCEFEFDIAGDVFADTTVLIDLPSWLPPVEAALNRESGVSILATSGRSYGYTRGIGYFLFSKVQLYQDKILLQEFSGDALWGSRLSRGSLNSAYLDQALTGMTDVSGDAITLSKNATPTTLRLSLPMLGGIRGIPSIRMRQQTFRLRLELRPLEECIECSDAAITYPMPWNEASYTVTTPTTTYTMKPLPRERIARPTITLETRHLYFDPDSRAELQKKKHEIPYSVFYENEFTFGGLDYKSANEAQQQYPTFVRDLDASHTASRMFWFLRTRDDLIRGRRWSTSGYNNPYYQYVSLLIAARDREVLSTPLIWNVLTPFAKEERSPGFAVGEMNWDLGAVDAREAPHEYCPEGSINFSTAEKPVILIYLRTPNASQTFKTEVVEMTLVIESWTLFEIEDGRGALLYGN
jgi:hypothetical protein